VINSRPDYVPERWHGTVMVFALILVALLFNTFLFKFLPQVETVVLLFHITLFVVFIIVITVRSPTKSSNDEVWTLFLNKGGYESKGLSFFVGLITPLFAFCGADSAVHMSEEIRGASRVVPWAMMSMFIPNLSDDHADLNKVSIFINGLTGFCMLVAILYCMGDIDAALASPTGYPFIEILTQVVSSPSGGTALSALLVVMFCFATLTLVASASRQLWAFARDRAVPHSCAVGYVNKRMKVPIASIAITCIVTCLLSLINIGSAAVLNGVLSLSVAGFFGSYLVPFTLFFYKRIKYPEEVPPGPWTMGRWGVFVNGFAIVWAVVVMFFSFWPTGVPVTPVNMNWSCVLWTAVILFALGFWALHGKKVYTGPVVETDVEGLGRVEHA
jgi:choline transport protein